MTAKGANSPQRGSASEKLQRLGIERYCEKVIAGESMTAIAKDAGVSLATLLRWLQADRGRATAAARAREFSAESYVDKAEQAIMKAKSKFALLKARELASHYRWKAAKIAPRDFGERLDVAGTLIEREAADPIVTARRIAFVLAEAAAQQRANQKEKP